MRRDSAARASQDSHAGVQLAKECARFACLRALPSSALALMHARTLYASLEGTGLTLSGQGVAGHLHAPLVVSMVCAPEL